MTVTNIIIAMCCCTIVLVGAVTPLKHNRPLAFSSLPSTKQSQHQHQHKPKNSNAFLCKNNKPKMLTKMSYTNDGNNNNDNDLPPSLSPPKTKETMIRRLSIRGVSVSPNGFLVLLSTTHTTQQEQQPAVITIPLRVTNPQNEKMEKDIIATTSAEALTILQLLGNVDMAGTIFPPQILQHVAAFHSALVLQQQQKEEEEEEESDIIEVEDELGLLSKSSSSSTFAPTLDECDDDDTNNVLQKMSAEELITKFVHQTLSHNITYDKANVWQRNKVKYPRISLDEIRVELPFQQEQEKEEKGEEMKWKESVLSSIQDQTTQQEEEGMVHPVPLKYILVCTVDESTKLEIPLYSEIPSSFSTSSKKMQYEMKNSELIAKSSCYIYDTMTSTSFLMICLALRYKCPIVMTSKVLDSFVNIQNLLNVENKNICLVYKQQLQQQKEETSTDDDDEGMDGNEINNTKKTKKAQKLQLEQQKKEEAHLSQILPSWKAANAIRKTSERVDRTVQRGFEENKLRGALRIALEKGDQVAVEKIRGEIERLRSLEDEEEEEEE